MDGLDELRYLLGGEGACEQVTLRLIKPLCLDGTELGFRLDALDGRCYPQRATNTGDRADDRQRFIAHRQVGNEAAIDLDLVETKAPQITER